MQKGKSVAHKSVEAFSLEFMTQSIILQIGQAGNQIGSQFWHGALSEHLPNRTTPRMFDASFSSFFRNLSKSSCAYGPVGKLKARGVMIDMEEGVIESHRRASLKGLFDDDQVVKSSDGSGNNWAVGNRHYGALFREEILEAVRNQVEMCDALGSFFLIHSLGGGTGSGLGSYVTELLQETYPEVYRFSTVMFPSKDDDVVISPYNSVLSLARLIQSSSCVLPVENQALYDICTRIDSVRTRKTSVADIRSKSKKPFDRMNNIVARLLLNLTSSMRFHGSLNVDINEIVTNLVPFPRLQFLVSSCTPLVTSNDVRSMKEQRMIDQMFTEAFGRESQMLKTDPRNDLYLSCALMVRGNVSLTDVHSNIERIIQQHQLRFASWNTEGWKVGMCGIPPLDQEYAMLCISNNCCVRKPMSEMLVRFKKLYRRRANLHHYTENGVCEDELELAVENIKGVVQEYQDQVNGDIEQRNYVRPSKRFN